MGPKYNQVWKLSKINLFEKSWIQQVALGKFYKIILSDTILQAYIWWLIKGYTKKQRQQQSVYEFITN